MSRPTDPSAHNAARKSIDDKGYVNEAHPSLLLLPFEFDETQIYELICVSDRHSIGM
jgi:hypothetical protein